MTAVATLDAVLEQPTADLSLPDERPARIASVRLASVDFLRGVVMILMALDHARFYFSGDHAVPQFLQNSSPALFFTRWITHFCAPTFFFLAGTSAFLALSRGGRTLSQISKFFWTRGLWLVFLAFTVVDFAAAGIFPHGHGDVIWCLGVSMVLMALLIRLPIPAIAALGVVVIVGHNLLDAFNPEACGRFAIVWSVLHTPGMYPVVGRTDFFTLFTLLPWAAVMAVGYACGPIFLRPDRRKIMFWLGFSVTAAFILLRAVNHYGNSSWSTVPHSYAAGPWTTQSTVVMTIASFLNVRKYPASLDFLLMTLGPMLMALAALDRLRPQPIWARFVLVFGRVPLFFYVLHLLLLRNMAIWVSWATHQNADWLQYGGPLMFLAPPSYGYSLPFIYAMWLTAVVALYAPCKLFMNVKQQHPDWWWLRYL